MSHARLDRRLALLGSLCAWSAMAGVWLTASRPTAAQQLPAPPAATVRLVIDYDDGAQKILTRLAWTDGMTVEDVLKAAHAAPHGITLESRGSKDTFFVLKIDDLSNKSDADRKKNWQYWVNEKYAKMSAGVQKVAAGDTVLWKFAPLPAADER